MPTAQGLSGKLPTQPQAVHNSQPTPGNKPLSPAIGEDNPVLGQEDGSAKSHSWPEPGQKHKHGDEGNGKCPQLPMDALASIPADAELSAALMTTKAETPQAPQITQPP